MMKSRAILALTAILCAAGFVPVFSKNPVVRGAVSGAPSGAVAAQGSAFTYQGQLVDNGRAATGSYDFKFTLCEGLTGANGIGTVYGNNVAVANGLFTVQLDFGQVYDGGQYYLETAVRPGTSTGAYTTLTPRQALTAVPYAMGLVFPLATVIDSTSSLINIENVNVGGVADFRGSSNVATGYFASSGEGDALRGDAYDTASGSGVTGIHYGTVGDAGYFEIANAANGGAGIYATTSGKGYAIEADGNVRVNGTLSKSAGTFRIDHPLDPANKYLNHSFVESPEMMNVYNGIAALDAEGKAEVALPEWFEALNKDFRYQLTAIGAPGPNLYIAQEVRGNRFKIAGGLPGQRVSWQVTGVRHDAYAVAHPIVVEEPKPKDERGTYLHPELFGQPASKAVGTARRTLKRERPAQGR